MIIIEQPSLHSHQSTCPTQMTSSLYLRTPLILRWKTSPSPNRVNLSQELDSCVVHQAGDPIVVMIPCFYPDKACSSPDYCDVLSQMIWSLGCKHGGNSGSLGMRGMMVISFIEGSETPVVPKV